MAKQVLPRVHVLVVCDEVVRHSDPVAAYDLTGVRTDILAAAFPYRHPQVSVYLQVTGHERVATCRVTIIRAETDEELSALAPEEEVHFTGPNDFIHLDFAFADCEFPAAGVYYVQVYFDDVLCGERALTLLESEVGGNGRAT